MRSPAWLTELPLSAADRTVVGERIEEARTAGLLTDEEAADRYARLATARTRGDLRGALPRSPGAVVPVDLLVAARLVAAVTFALTVVQIVVWVLVMVFSGNAEEPWWMWTALPGAAAVAGLWQARRWLSRRAR
ncbi:DUF1707 domain-containing protein [Amycolatopsis sp. CA-230715]|uniref:DUF1707 domain-containing protein n=1 Tax=Amycolatopsis sp. CA-230715 TaxID=2745196 RepID=UPI001C016B8A|nr:DUF1707 domain-containing protein [Amycolatopsis sp. CA-230715]QWF76748.1 hypothetical protein HUW46_00124 [Amycolatopsis sp. CA-230715]